MERDAGPAYAAYGGDERRIFGDRCRSSVGGCGEACIGRRRRRSGDGVEIVWFGRRGVGERQYLWRFSCDPPHVGDVQEETTVMQRLPVGGGAWAVRRFGPMCAFSVEECRRMRGYLVQGRDMAGDHTPESFADDCVSVFAAAYAFVLAGEAAGRISQSFKNETSEIPWGELAVTRHRLAHSVDAPNPELVAEMVFTHAPMVIERIDALLDQESP